MRGHAACSLGLAISLSLPEMNILSITSWYPPYHAGGYGMLCYRLSEGLLARGHKVSVLTLANSEHECPQDPGDYSVQCNVIRTFRRVDSRNLIRGTLANHRETRRVLYARKPDIVIFFSTLETGFQVYHDVLASGLPCLMVLGDTWLAQAWADLPRYDDYVGFASGRGQGIKAWSKRVLGFALKSQGLFNGCKPISLTPVMAISSFLLDALAKAGVPQLDIAKQCRVFPLPVLPPFIDVNGNPAGMSFPCGNRPLSRIQEEGITQDTTDNRVFRIICVSRLDPQKGQDDVIRALALVRQQGLNATLTLAGMDRYGYCEILRRLITDLHVESYVSIITNLEEEQIKQLYCSHDVFVFPSRIIEGLGIVCVEAMACGLPVVATSPGGQDDLVIPNSTGFRYAPADIEGLARHLTHLAGDLSLMSRLRREALKLASRHYSVSVMDDFERRIQEVVQEHISRAKHL